MVRECVSGVMKDPKQLRADLNRIIGLKRRDTRGDPGREARIWTDRLAEVERKRTEYQEAFAADAVTLLELKAYLAQLDETRKTAERELESLRGHEEYVRELEVGRDDLLDSLWRRRPKRSPP